MYYNLYAELMRKGWTQTDLAKFLGLTLSNVNMKLRGKQGWTIAQIKKVCREFDSSFEYLFETR